MFSFTSQYLVSKNFHFKSNNTLFRRAGVKRFHFKISREKRYRDRGQGDRKILPAPGTNQIAGFSGYRPLTIKEINKNKYYYYYYYGPKPYFYGPLHVQCGCIGQPSEKTALWMSIKREIITASQMNT